MSDEKQQSTSTRSIDVSLIARLGAKSRKMADKAKAEAKRANDAEARVKELEKANADLKIAGDSNASAQRVAQLEREILTRDTRSQFEAFAKEAGVRPEFAGDLWELAKIDVATKPDAAALKAAIADQKTKRAGFFGDGQQAAGTGAAGGTGSTTAKPGPGSGQAPPGGTGTIVHQIDEDRAKNDPAYIMRNWSKIVEVAKAKAQ